MEKKNKIIITILIIITIISLVLCILFATKTISFNTNKTNNIEEEKLPKWATYLINQNIKNITVHRTYKGESFDPSIGCLETKQIEVYDLKQILEKMTKGKLTKYIENIGFGGPCLTDIIIEYNENNKLELVLYEYIITKDDKILSLLEKEEYTEKKSSNSSNEEPNTIFRYNWDTSFVETLFQ